MEVNSSNSKSNILRRFIYLFGLCLLDGVLFYSTFLISRARLVWFAFDNKAVMSLAQQKNAFIVIFCVTILFFVIINVINLLMRGNNGIISDKSFLINVSLLSILPLCFVVKWMMISKIEYLESAPFTTLIIITIGLIFLGLVIKTIIPIISNWIEKKEDKKKFYNWYLPLVVLFSLIYAFYMSLFTIKRYLSFNAGFGDLTFFHNLVWNSSHGRFLATQIHRSGYHMPDHFDPILILVSITYWIYSSPITLLILQSIVIGASGLLIFLIGRRLIKSNFLAFALSLSFLINPATHGMNTFDFHSFTLSVFTILLSFYMLEKRSLIGSIIAVALMLISREDIPIIGATIGLFLIISEGRWRSGLAVLLVSLVYFLIALTIISHFGRAQGEILYSDMIAKDGGSFISVIMTFITNPIYSCKVIFTKEKLIFFLQMSIPVIFLFFKCRWGAILFCYPIILHLLSSNSYFQAHSIGRHYLAPTLAIIYYTSILGIKNILVISNKKRELSLLLGILIIIASFIMTFCYGNFPLKYNSFDKFLMTKSKKGFQDIITKIPADKSISAQTALSPLVGSRKLIHCFPNEVNKVDFILLDIFGTIYPYEKYSEFMLKVAEILKGSTYGIKYYKNDYLILEKGAPADMNLKVLDDILRGGTNVLHPGKNTKIESSPIYKTIENGAFANGVYLFGTDKTAYVQVDLPCLYKVNEILIKFAGSDVTTENLTIKISYVDELGRWVVFDELKEVNINYYEGSNHCPLPSIGDYHKVFDPIMIKSFGVDFMGHGWFSLGIVRMYCRE